MIVEARAELGIPFDPRGVVDARREPLSARRPDLGGLRLAILDNSKWNANKLLRATQRLLEERYDLGAVDYHVKHSFSKDAAPELIEQIAAEADIVLTAIGDCGSCCSCCVRDAIALERLGVASAAIVTTEFVRETELTRQAVGMPDLEPIVVDHPISSLTLAELDERASEAARQAARIWTGGNA